MRLRLQPSVVLLALLIVLGLLVYIFFTAPLPPALSAIFHTPGSTSASSPIPPGAAGTTGRAPAGQPLQLGTVTVTVESVQRGQDLSSNNRSGPPGSFALLPVTIQNGGNAPVVLKPEDFALVDQRGRVYAVDSEASRAASQYAKRRYAFEASVPAGGRLQTELAFEPPQDAGALTLRVSLGSGELEIPG